MKSFTKGFLRVFGGKETNPKKMYKFCKKYKIEELKKNITEEEVEKLSNLLPSKGSVTDAANAVRSNDMTDGMIMALTCTLCNTITARNNPLAAMLAGMHQHED